MKKIISALSILLIFLSACSSGQSQNVKSVLSATAFATKIQELPQAPIIDVRSPEEFANGHVQNARNINWNGSDFDAQISKFDKSQPILVYCLSGGRSGSAASHMRENGFKEVYEMEGGMMQWRSAKLPETTDNKVVSAGMSKQDFEKLLQTDKVVLIDFYAEWCAPCKKMKPFLDEISNEMADHVVVVRIDADANPALCAAMKIEALPVIQLYKNQKLVWNNLGFIEKANLVTAIEKMQ
jgi:thioredoxin 1